MIFLLLIAGALAIAFVIIYNGLVAKKNAVENAFASLDALLKKRYDLVPNLVAAAQQYMVYEKETLATITELRAKAMAVNISSEEKTSLADQMAPLLRNVLVSAENYPDLKASVRFSELQAALKEAEAQIAGARTGYNQAVTEFNNAVEMFPSGFVAGLMGLQRKRVMESPAEERKNVNVKELFRQ